MKNLLLLFSLLLSIHLITAAENESKNLFQKANDHYANAAYNEAKESYLELLKRGFISDEIHYNLANSYFKSNQIAEAILHYEKALKINPSNEDAAYNLKIANAKTVDKIEAIPELFIYRWWKSTYQLFSVSQWAQLTIFAFYATLLFFIAYLLFNALLWRKIGLYAAFISLFIAFCSWFLASQQNQNLQTAKNAIIMDPTVNIVSAPSSGSSQLFVLHEGTKVAIEDQVKGWHEVSLPNGNKGWVENKYLEEI